MNVTHQTSDIVPPELQWVLGLGILIVVLGGWIGSSIWVLLDADRRSKSGCLIGLLVFLTWPLGLCLWLVTRPPLPPPIPSRRN